MRRQSLLLAVVGASALLLHLILAFRWNSLDRQPPGWDPAVHLGTALDYRQAWRENRWFDLIRTVPRPGHPQYPFAYHYSLAPFLQHPAPHRRVVFLNLAYFLLLVYAGAWLAYQTSGPPAAAAALFVLGLSPGLLYKFREAFPDLALAAWTTLAYALVVRSQGFKNRGSSLAAGLCAGLAVLSKWGAVLYLLPAAASGLADRGRRRNLALALAAAVLLCLPWYAVNTVTMLPRIWASVTLGHHQGNPLTWTWNNWLYYPSWVVDCYSWPAVALMLAGCALALRRWAVERRNGRQGPQVCLAAWLAFSYLFCTLVPSKDDRYFLPAAAALPVLGLSALPGPVLALSAGLALLHSKNIRRPEPGDWHQKDILKTVEARRSSKLAGLCVLANHRDVNPTSLSWMARHQGLSSIYLGGYQSEIPEWSQFVLIKTGDPGPFLSERTLTILGGAASGGGLFARVFRPAARWPLPDGSEALLYEQKPDIPWISRMRRFEQLDIKGARLEGVVITPREPGRYVIEVRTLLLDKLPAPIEGIKIEISGARLFEDGGKVYVLGLESLRLLSARLALRDLQAALSRRASLPIALASADSELTAHARLGPLPVELSLSVALEGSGLRLEVRRLALAGLPVPFASRLAFRRTLEARPPYQPYGIDLGALRFSPETISIGGA
jgi:hypothetical protein